MIDLVCPLGNGSLANNIELKFSLRSLEKFGIGVRNVFIVGELPKWCTNVIHIPCGEHGTHHERNIMEKFHIACKDDRVSENFVMWNDDFFLLRPTDLEHYPFYHLKGGTLIDAVNARPRFDGYAMSLDNSRKFLEAKGLPSLHYDVHCPIIYNKQRFLDTVVSADWDIPSGYTIKSLYANQITEAVDRKAFIELKIKKVLTSFLLENQIKDRHVFSISDTALGFPLRNWMDNFYKNKSKYEK